MAPTDAIPNLPVSPAPQTPPSSPELRPHKRALDPEQVQLLADLLKAVQAIQSTPTAAGTNQPATTEEPSGDDSVSRERGSKLEYKRVHEIWDEKAYTYQIVEPTAPSGEVDELDKYVFVIRVRVDKKTMEPTFYVDIKSEGLRDILRTILRDVKGICLREDKLTVEQKLLYNHITKLEEYQCDGLYLKHFNLLVDFIKVTYDSTTERLTALLEGHEITYDLLWALFKPNMMVYTTCYGTGKPRCVKYHGGEERTMQNGLQYFNMECCFIDFDGKVCGETSAELVIEKFRGTKRIDSLDVFPLHYHPEREEVKKNLIKYGQKFISLMGVHHRQYRGNAFYMHKGRPNKFAVDSRIMIDAIFFQEVNPNYTMPHIEKSAKNGDSFIIFSTEDPSEKQSGRVKRNGKDPAEMMEDDLIFCSPTVPGFSYRNKLWAEFAVADIQEISWNPLPFAQLAIPSKKKEVIQALVEAHTGQGSAHTFDDFVTGKGLGLIVLLHGLPGLGKTMTAEGISEYLQKPLYSISAGELGTTVEKLEAQLPLIFHRAEKWKAVLLLDEADVFLEQRSSRDVHRNALVSVFLRELEYYQGIMFLTTNRVKQIDDAIASRVHLPLIYKPLSLDDRRGIWKGFLEKAVTEKGEASCSREDVERLAEKNINGRQIRNTVSTACALAARKGCRVDMSLLEVAIAAVEEFEYDFGGAGRVGSLQSYA